MTAETVTSFVTIKALGCYSEVRCDQIPKIDQEKLYKILQCPFKLYFDLFEISLV